MNETTTIGIIRPEQVARKLAAIRNYEDPVQLDQITANPRLVEMLWFLQWESMQPGGLPRFVEELVKTVPHRFGTPTLRAVKGDDLTLDQKIHVYSELQQHDAARWPIDAPPDFNTTIAFLAGRGELPPAECTVPEDRKNAAKYLSKVTAEKAKEICLKNARRVLPEFYFVLCTAAHKRFEPVAVDRCGRDGRFHSICSTWFMDDPIAAVIEVMDRRVEVVAKRLAMTEVSKRVFDALDYAMEERAMVRVEGDSRFGKTESVRAWCDMRPGRARLVSVPSSNSLADLHRRIAEALGMEVSYGSGAQRLKERIEFVMQHGGLFLALDEAAFLVPQNYSAATAPARLNWVRTEIIDRGLPLAVIVTPQSFMPAVDRFVKKTGYAMEQFFGRNHRTVRLPNELDQGDMVAVARIHFPEMDEDHLELVADLASISENYLQAVEAISKLARYIARREKHRRVTVADIELAASEIIPRSQQPSISHESEAESHAENTSLDGHSRRVKAPLIRSERGLKPARRQTAAEPEFSMRSLRSAASERPGAELVSA
jgi:hypothetical protein